MTPDTRLVAGDFAGRLMQVIAPGLNTQFLMGTASLMAASLGMMVEEWDRAADRLAEENTAVRALLAQGAPLAPGGLSARLRDISMTADADLKVSTLQAANNVLRAALIELQAWAEEQTGPAVTALNEAIWAELARSTERRRFSATPF